MHTIGFRRGASQWWPRFRVMQLNVFTAGRRRKLAGHGKQETGQTRRNVRRWHYDRANTAALQVCIRIRNGHYRLYITRHMSWAQTGLSFISIQPLEAGLAGTRAQSCNRYGSGTLHPGQVLGGSLLLLSPAFRRSHFHRQVPVRPQQRERS